MSEGDELAPHGTQPPGDGHCGDAAIYLLGLLDAARAESFAEHARSCAICRDELRTLAPAVDVLPATVTQLAAPPPVKGRLMARVREAARESAPRPSLTRRVVGRLRRGVGG